MVATLRARWGAAPMPHRVMLLAAPALMLAWLLVRGEPAKHGVLLLGMLLLLATATTAVRQLTFVGSRRTIIVLALAAALANCSAQRAMFTADFARTQSEIDAFTCDDVHAIEAGGTAAGRAWTRGPFDGHVAQAPQAWRWIDLYLQPMGEGRYSIRAGAWTGDDVFGGLDCRTGATASR